MHFASRRRRKLFILAGIVGAISLVVSLMMPSGLPPEQAPAAVPAYARTILMAVAHATRDYSRATGAPPRTLEDIENMPALASEQVEDAFRAGDMTLSKNITYTPEFLGRTSVLLAYMQVDEDEWAVLYFFTDRVVLRSRSELMEEIESSREWLRKRQSTRSDTGG